MKTIVVTGTHGVGKTSLCNRLVEKLSNVLDIKMIPEMARILIAKGIPLNDKANEFAIVSYIAEYLRYTRETRAALVVSDRSVFDLFAYISLGRAKGVRDEFFSLAQEVVFQEVQWVNAYVYVPIEFGLLLDNVRPVDAEYQQAVDIKIQELLRFFGATVLTVSGTLEERTTAVTSWLNV